MIPSMFDQISALMIPKRIPATRDASGPITSTELDIRVTSKRVTGGMTVLERRAERIIQTISGNVNLKMLEERFALTRKPITEALDFMVDKGRLTTWKVKKTRWWNLSNSEIANRRKSPQSGQGENGMIEY